MTEDYTIPSDIPAGEQTGSAPAAYSRPLTTTLTTPAEEQQAEPNDNLERYNQIVSFLGKGSKLSAKKTAEELTQSDLDAANTAYLEKINSHMESIGAEPFPDLGSVDFDAIAKKEEEYNVKNANENLKKVKSKYPSLSNIPEFTSLEDIKKRSSEINTKKQSLESQEAVSAWNKQAKEMNEKFGVSVPTIKSASELSSAKKKLKNIVDTYDKAAPVKLMEFPVSPMATQPGGVRGDIPAQNLATQPSVQNLQKKKEELKKESEGMYRQYKADMAFMPKMVELGVSPQSIELITGKTTGHPIQSYTDPKIVETKEEAYSKAAINHINGDISNIDKQIKETSSALQAATPDQYEELSSKWKSLVKARDILVDKQAYLNQEVRRIRIGAGETGTIGNEMVGTIEALTYAFINTGARILSGIPSFSLQLVSSALDSPLANKAVSESLGELSKNVAEFGDIFKKPMEYAFGRTEESLTENYPVSSFLGSMGLYLVPELSAGQSAAMMFSDNFSSNYQKYKNLPPENAFIINSLQSAASAYLMSKGLEVTKGHGAINGIVYEALNMMPKPIRLSQLNPAIDKILSSAKTGVSSSISSGLSFAALNPATVATESLISNVNNWISENKVDAHDFAQTTLDMLHSSARGIKDGIIIGGIMAPVNAWRTNSMNKEMFATASMLRDHATMTVSINKIKQAVANGTITKEQGTENIKGLMNLLNKINQIPKNISINHQFEAFKLLNENERLQQESSGLNESFKKPFLDNIERNNKRLEKIGMMSDQISYHESEGGSTFVRGRNQLGEKVSSVSIFPERTVKIEGPVTQEDIDNFKEANKDLLEGNEDILSVGTWKDKDGKTHIDISAITPHAEAEALGRMYNQKAVFNLEKNKEVPTGGTGEPMEGMKSEADRVKDIRELVGRTKATEADFKPIGVEEVASRLGEKHPMVRAVNNAMSALTKLPGFLDNNTINVRFHDSHASMQHAMNTGGARQLDAKSTKGSFSYKKNSKGGYDITIDFNLKKGTGDATIRHEFTHAMLLHLIGDRSLDVMKKFQDAFRSFGSKYNDKAVMEFAERYSKKTIRPEEYFAELSAIRRNIKPSVLSKIAEFINGLAKSVFGDKFVPFKNVNDANDVIRYFGSLAKAVRTGEAVDLKPFDKIEGSHNMIAYDTKINIEDGVDKITITKDANGNEVERRSEFTEDDIESELNRLEELAKEKKLTFDDFKESYFGQAAEDDARAEAKIDIKNDQLKFVQDLRKALEGESVEVKEKDTEEDVTKEGEEPLIDKIKSKQSLGGKFTSELMAQEIIDELKEGGYLKEEESILSLRGKTVIAMWPDNKMVGDLFFGEGDKKRKVLEGNGGIYFPLKFNKDGTFWASTHKGSNALMDTINKLFDENGGESVYVVVFKGTDTKVLSSRDGMAAAMDIIAAIAENGDIPLSLFKSALSKATEKELLPDGKKRFPANQSSAEMHKQIKDFFLGADDKSFKRRSEIAKKIISTVFKDKSLNHEKIASDLGMKLGKSGKIMVSDVFERLGNVQEEGFLENVKKGSPYAIVEIPSKLTIKEDKKHVSYPATMKTVDGKRVIVSTLRDNSMNLADIQTKSGVPLSELDRKQAQGAIGNAQRGFNVIKIEPSVKSKQQLVTDKKMIKKMTEDEDGNYLFYHYSPNKIAGKIDPRFFGRNPKTGRDERPGIGISMYYTRPDYRDVGGNYGYVVRVPKDKVYPFNEDPLNLYDKAEATFQKMYPGQAFDPNKQVAFIAQEAAKLGYDMTVAKWGDQLRAQTTKPMKGEWYEKPHPEYRYSPVYNPKLEGFQANEKKPKSKQRLDEEDVESTAKALRNQRTIDDETVRSYGSWILGESKQIGSNEVYKKLPDSAAIPIEGKYTLKIIPISKTDLYLKTDRSGNPLLSREHWEKDNEDMYQTDQLDMIKKGFDTKNREPIIVETSKDGLYNVVDGHHRLTIAKELGRNSIIALVRDYDGKEVWTTKDGNYRYIAEAYHKAKADGSNPELVKAVEASIGEPKSKQRLDEWEESRIGKGDRAITDRNENVKNAAEEYYQGNIDIEEYNKIVDKNSEISPITSFIKPAKEEDIIKAVGEKSKSKVNLDFEAGKRVGLRLDIPAYIRHNIWAITVHENGKQGIPLSYNNVARIKNVEFVSDPTIALDIARHKLLSSGERMGKTTIARMMGDWVPIEGETSEDKGVWAMNMVDEIKNNPEWSQIGMNPFRHSYFYDRATKKPVIAAEEVIQIGGLVYAKNVKTTSIHDERFTVYTDKQRTVPLIGKGGVKSKFRLSFGDNVNIEGVNVNIPKEKEQDILKADRSTKKYFDDKVKEMKPSGLSKDELKKLLDSDNMAILTGTNPDGNAVDDKTNDSLNKKAEEWLKENNYKYHEVTGKYGQTESSFIVEGMTAAEAMDFAERFKQDSVAHSEGLVYRRGAINRRDNSGDEFGVDVTGPEEDFVSAIKTKDGEVVGFKIGYDFDKEEEYNPEVKSKQRLDEEERLLMSEIGIDRSSIPIDKNSKTVDIGEMTSSNGGKLKIIASEINLSYPGKKKFIRKIEAIDEKNNKSILSFWEDKNNVIIVHVEGANRHGTDLIKKLIKEANDSGVNKIIADDVESLSASKYWENKLGFSKDPDVRANRILDLSEYRIAKEDGSNPKLVKTVDDIIGESEPKSKQRLDDTGMKFKDEMQKEFDRIKDTDEKGRLIDRAISKASESWAKWIRGNQDQYDEAVRQFKKDNGVKVKSAPSHETIFGEKPSKMEVDNKGSLKAQIKLEMMAAMGGRVATEDFMKSVAKGVNSMAVDGVITPDQATRIIKRMANLDQNNPEALDKFYKWVDEMFEGAKQNQEKIEGRAETKGQMSVKNFMRSVADRVKSMAKRGVITANQASAITKRMAFLNPKNAESVNKFYDWVDKIFSNADYADKLKEASTNRNKIKGKLNSKEIPPELAKIAKRFSKIDPSEVSDIDEYNKMSNMLWEGLRPNVMKRDKYGNIVESKREAVNMKDMNRYIESQEDAMQKKKEKAEKAAEEDPEIIQNLQDSIDQLSDIARSILETGINPIDGTSVDLTSKEKSILKKFLDMKPKEKKTLMDTEYALKHFIENGDTGLMEYARERYDIDRKVEVGINALKRATGLGIKRLPVEWVVSAVRSLKNIIPTKYEESMRDYQYLTNSSISRIDTLLRNIEKGSPVFKALFRDIAAGYSFYKNKTKEMNSEKIYQKMLKGLNGDIKKAAIAKYKITMYLRQLEHESNPGSSKSLPAMDYMKATIEAAKLGTNKMSKYSRKVLEKLIQEYSYTDADGVQHIDKDKIYDSLSEPEKNAVSEIQKLYKDLLPFAKTVAEKIRNNPFDEISNYVSIAVNDSSLSAADINTLATEMQAYLPSSLSTKAGQIEDRTGVARSIDMDPFSTVNKAVRNILLDHSMTSNIMALRRITKDFREESVNGDDDVRLFAIALDNVSNEVIKSVVGRSYTERTTLSEAMDLLTRKSVTYMLAGLEKITKETGSNIAFVSAFAPAEFANGAKYMKYITSGLGGKILEVVNSYNQDRLYPHGGDVGKVADTESYDISVSSSQNIPSDAQMIAFKAYYNTLNRAIKVGRATSEGMLSGPDIAMARPLWFGSMAMEFKRITGKEIDFDKIANSDAEYLESNMSAIEQARDVADKNVVDAASTKNPFLRPPKLTMGSRNTQLWSQLNNFLSGFGRKESEILIDSIDALYREGQITKTQAVKTIAAVTARAATYRIIGKVMAGILSTAGVYLSTLMNDDEDDKLEAAIRKKISKNPSKMEMEAAQVEKGYFTEYSPKIEGIDTSINVTNRFMTSDEEAVAKMDKRLRPKRTLLEEGLHGAAAGIAQLLLNRNFGNLQNSLITAPLFEEYINSKFINNKDYNKYEDQYLVSGLPSSKQDLGTELLSKTTGPFGLPISGGIELVKEFQEMSSITNQLEDVNNKLKDIDAGTPVKEFGSRDKGKLDSDKKKLEERYEKSKRIVATKIAIGTIASLSSVPALKDIIKVVKKASEDVIIKTTDWDKLVKWYEEAQKQVKGSTIPAGVTPAFNRQPQQSQYFKMTSKGYKLGPKGWYK